MPNCRPDPQWEAKATTGRDLVARKKSISSLPIHGYLSARETRVLFVETNDLEFVTYKRQMKRFGIWDVSCVADQVCLEEQIEETFFNVIIIDIPGPSRERESLNLLSRLRGLGFRGIVAMVAEEATMDVVYRCTRLGASEFWLKTDVFDVGEEVQRLLEKRPPMDRSQWHPEMNISLGLFTSAGLSDCELELVCAFADGFPKHSEIATKLNKSEPYVRKIFSRIYNKLSAGIPIENSAQLAHLITICSLYI